jgi:hypothetical protein
MAFFKINENSQLRLDVGSDSILFDSLVSFDLPESSVKREGKKTIIGSRVGKYLTGQRELEMITFKLSNIQAGHYNILKDLFKSGEKFELIYTESDNSNVINFIQPLLHMEPRQTNISEDEATMDMDLVIKCAKVEATLDSNLDS